MSSSNNTNKTNVPEAKEAMNRFKMEVAGELGVPLSNGYNGNLSCPAVMFRILGEASN